MAPTKFYSFAQLGAHIGQEAGVSDWFPITQERIDQFAHATNDRQWIHTDKMRAAQLPYSTTVAHDLLTLSLLSGLLASGNTPAP